MSVPMRVEQESQLKSFVASPAEIAAIQAVITKPRFTNCQMLSVVSATDPAWLRQVIPAPLEPNGDTVRVMVGRWQSNCVGDFAGAGVYVPARFGDIEGEYVIAMYMDIDSAILYGREVFGEPKKLAQSRVHKWHKKASGFVDRFGKRIITLEVDLTEDRGVTDARGVNFNIKAQPATNGVGLEDDATLTVADFDVHFDTYLGGTGKIKLESTDHDPLGSIPLGEVRDAFWQEGDLIAEARSVAKIPAASFAPYFYARVDDYALMNTELPTL